MKYHASLIHCHAVIPTILCRIAIGGKRIPLVNTGHGWPESRLFKVVNILKMTTDYQIAISTHLQKEFIRLGFPKEKVSVIYNSINPSDFNGRAVDNVRQQLGANSSQILLGIVSRISEKRKGHSILFQALKQLITEFPNIRLAVIGDGSLKTELEKVVQNLELTDYVRFTGNRRDIPEIIASLDIVILPSLWEGLPVVLLEAMAAAKPVVATAVNGTIEVVQDGKTGILVSPNDSASLANGIRELLIDKNKAKSMGLAGRLFVKENFSSKEMVKKINSLYIKLLEQDT